MDTATFAKLFEEAKARKLAAESLNSAASKIQEALISGRLDSVDTTGLGGTPMTDAEKDLVVDTLRDIITEQPTTVLPNRTLGVARDDIILNNKQQEFCDAVVGGKDTILIGAAGTGKTTSMRGTTRKLIELEKLPKLNRGTKYLSVGNPGGAILSYTRKAVNNIRHAVVDELKSHTLTIHKLLEFEPVFYQIPDPDKVGEFKTTMRFEPARSAHNPLPPDLIFLAFEESSMIGLQLYSQLEAAMPHPHQEVFLGDIQQLPPIFGLAILGFKMNELPTIELTQVYRQALNSPIISLAWDILRGDEQVFNPRIERFVNEAGKPRQKVPALEKFTKKTDDGEVKFTVWQNKINPDMALQATVTQFKHWEQSGYYKPDTDIILMPFNVGFGTLEMNKGIHDFLGKKRGAVVHEIISGWEKHYLAVGDRVLYDKEDAFITEIRRNGEYMGNSFQPASVHLDRWGHMERRLTEQERLQAKAEDETFELKAMDAFLSDTTPITDRVHQASHVIEVQLSYSDGEDDGIKVLSSAAEINNLLGGHCLTVHKFQGSEAERVFFFMHQSHATMNQRELLYTAVTRAKNFLHIVAEPDTFWKGIRSQQVKGNTLAEKAEFFKGKKDELDKLRSDELQFLTHHNSLKVQVVAETAAEKVVTISGQKAIKLEDLPSKKIKQEAAESLAYYWQKAIDEFGAGIGPVPKLAFSISSRKIVGLAVYKYPPTIKLNPVWLAVAEKDEEVYEQMLVGTMIHEICHHVAGRKYRDYGHDVYWRNCMKKMGRPVVGRDVAVGLPSWADSKNSILMEVLGTVEEQPTETVQLEKDEVE